MPLTDSAIADAKPSEKPVSRWLVAVGRPAQRRQERDAAGSKQLRAGGAGVARQVRRHLVARSRERILRRLDFASTAEIFADSHLTRLDDRNDYGELR